MLDYLVGEHGYGNKESRTGKALEKKFGGIGYGWDRDMLRLILAVLFRAGSIEITHGGEKFDSYQDPRSRTPLVNNTAFKSALFTPVKPIVLQRPYQGGRELRGSDRRRQWMWTRQAIAEALKEFAAEEIKRVLPIEAQAQAHRLPVLGTVQEYKESLTSIETGSADDCVTILAGEGRLPQGSATTGFARSTIASMRRGSCPLRNARRAVGRGLEPARSPGAHRPPATGRDAQGTFVYRVALRLAILDQDGDPGDPGGVPQRCTRLGTPTGRSSSGRRSRRSRGGRNGRRARDDAGAGAGSAPVPLLLGAAPAGRVDWRARPAGRP